MDRVRNVSSLAIPFLLTVIVSLSVTSSSSAETFTASASLSDTKVSAGSPVLASVHFDNPFASIEGVCFQFTFEGDLLDVGDALIVTPLNLLPSMSGPGFFNAGPGPQFARTLCVLNAFGYEPITSLLLDGSEDRIEVAMESGSVTIADLQIIIMGITSIAEQLADLSVAVNGLGPGTSLGDKVQKAHTYYASGDLADTCSTLTAFVNEVTAQSGKSVLAATADQLISKANQIKAVLGC